MPAAQEIADRARAAGRIALDTEFISEGRYQALLCLVQVAAEDGGETLIEVVDALAQADHAPLADVLADPRIEVVVHAGRQDVALVRRTWRTEVRNLFDTQVAAAFVGHGIQAGYETVLAEVLGTPPSPSATFTRWERRPLTEEQIAYARKDVEHLLELAAALRARLERLGRLEWAREESMALEQASDHRDPEEVFRRLPKVAGLRPGDAAVARELALWREQAAAADDRPAKTVLADASLVELARTRPKSPEQLRDVRGLREAAVRRHGEEMIAAIRRGAQAEPVRLPRRPYEAVPPQAGPLVALSDALVRAHAHEEELAPQLIANRDELTEIVTATLAGRDEPDVRALHGWRRDVVGAELLELLRGRRTLSVGPAGRLRAERPG